MRTRQVALMAAAAVVFAAGGVESEAESAAANPAAGNATEERLETPETPTANANANGELISFVENRRPAVFAAIARDDHSAVEAFYDELGDEISGLGLPADVDILRANPYGMVAKTVFRKGEAVSAPVNVLLYRSERETGTSAAVTLYPTALVISDSDGSIIPIYAEDSLAAYRACCNAIAPAFDRYEQDQNIRRELRQAKEEAAKARQDAAIARFQAEQSAAAAREAQEIAELERSMRGKNRKSDDYDDDDDYRNWSRRRIRVYNNGFRYYVPGFIPVPPPGPHPTPRPEPNPPPKPNPPHPQPKPPQPAPQPQPSPKPEVRPAPAAAPSFKSAPSGGAAR